MKTYTLYKFLIIKLYLSIEYKSLISQIQLINATDLSV